eukprot:TRINITY_DN29957_c0_g1_i1.p1 TRINITY_DN29957_c0_g1~~TRINITY_DN29957_c0_g1_i1.p1  ORF type:complete len:752 (+),score=165.85 TRINITY_DN29957_c0_g1_i1:82-2337(+)
MVLRKVIFVRHGESQGNAKAVYSGWGDTPLSVRGEQEAVEAGLCIKASGMKFDAVFTSVLSRAIKTVELVLSQAGQELVPVVKDWRLNARHSGGLSGLTQAEAVAIYGEAKVTLWRSSYDVLPACVELSDPRHPVNDPRYNDVPRDQLPGGESLAGVVERVVPYWRDSIVPKIQAGESVLIVAHKNSFRALWKYIERTPDDDAVDSKLAPASAPLVFEFDDIGSGLVFKKKYIMSYAHWSPKLGPKTMKVLGTVYFLRHAETVNNARGIDNGWEDTALTLKGEQQAAEAGLCLKEKGVKVDIIFTSVLQRAIRTAEVACMTSNNAFAVPVVKSWRLNARHSGVLHGLSHEEAVAKYGQAVAQFRTEQGAPPGCLDKTDSRHPSNDPLYADLPAEELQDIPSGESFDMMAKRVLAFWEGSIIPHIKAGKSVLIVAHRNPLKAITEHLAAKTGAFDAQVRSTLPFVHEFGLHDGNPVVLNKYSLSSYSKFYLPAARTVGKAVFLRHGESSCNFKEAFTGWEDSQLTEKGKKQAAEAGRLLLEDGFKFDAVFTSYLSRASESVEIVCKESNNTSAPVFKSWRCNARHPGVLQGMTKPEAMKVYGKDKVNLWRGSYDVMPECVALTDPRHPVNDPLYAGIPAEELPPGGESLAKCLDRIVPFWRDEVAPRIQAGETVLMVGHKNSMKALFMYLEDQNNELEMFEVRPVSATAPLVFEFSESGLASGITIQKKYWVKHTDAEGLAKGRCKDGSLHM